MLAVSCAKTPIAFIIGSMNVLSLHLFERSTILQWILSTSLSLSGPIVHSSPVTRMKPSGGSSVLLRLEFPCKVLPETLITAISAWTVVVDTAENDEQRIETAASWCKSQSWPSTFKPLHSGGIVGRQSNDRAELYAIIIAVSIIQNIRIFSDSLYALGILEIILNPKP